MFSSGLDGRTQVLDLSNNTVSDIFIRLFLWVPLVKFKPQVTALENEVFQRAGDCYSCIFFTLKKTCSLLFVFVLKAMKCLLQGFGIFNAFFSRTGKASLIQRAISTRIETQKEKHTMKLGQLKINCLPLLWDHIGPPWCPGQPHQPRWAGPFRQQTYPGRT